MRLLLANKYYEVYLRRTIEEKRKTIAALKKLPKGRYAEEIIKLCSDVERLKEEYNCKYDKNSKII